MAVVDMEGFDWLPNTNGGNFASSLIADGWVGDVSEQLRLSSPGRFGYGNAMQIGRTAGEVGAKQVYKLMKKRVASGTFVVGFAWYQNPIDASANPNSFRLYDGIAGATRVICTFQRFGQISCGGFTSNLGAYIEETWNYIEIKGSIGTPGDFEVKLNGDIIIQGNSVTVSGGFDFWSVRLGDTVNDRVNSFFDDVYVLDDTGGVNTDYLGNVRVVAQRPVSDGDVIQLDPVGAATNWQAGDNPGLSGGIYAETDVVGEYDLYDMNPNIAARDIFAAQVKTFLLQDNGIQLRGGPIIKTGGVEYGSEDRGLAGGYRSVVEIWDRNPGTTNPWTAAELNAIQAGPKLVSSA